MMKIIISPKPRKPKQSFIPDMSPGTIFIGSGESPSVYLKTTQGYVDVQTGIHFTAHTARSMFPHMDAVLTVEEHLE